MNKRIITRLTRAIFLVFLVSGCTGLVQTPAKVPYSKDIEPLLSGTMLLGHPVRPEELPDLDLFGITPEMAAFAEQAVRHSDGLFDKVRDLHKALLSASGRGIAYNAYRTEVPRVTFESRSANCLSYTLLYISLARYLKIDAYVNQVDIPPTWDLRTKNEVVFFRHVNVRIPMRGEDNHRVSLRSSMINSDDVIIDLEMNRYSYTYNQRAINDQETAAEFYSNRGTEFLATGDYPSAFLNLRKAISEDDQVSYLWSNLGSVYLRAHHYHEAELLYLHGLKLNAQDLTIINNLAWLYERLGNQVLADHYAHLAQRYRQTNPYYQYNLALEAYEDKNYESALLFTKRALVLESHDPRFYEFAAMVYDKLGRTKDADSMRAKMKAVKPRF